MTERIEAAAIRLATSIVITVPQPQRHHDVIRHARSLGHSVDDIAGGMQGFFTSSFGFVNRREAVPIAEGAGQRLRVTGPADMLFTEDMW